MENVMLDPLPTEWNGYKVNASFRIGMQVHSVSYDKSLSDYEKTGIIIDLLFNDRDYPREEQFEECLRWFLSGWYHDHAEGESEGLRYIDYDIDQWRIYADFRQIYGINLSLEDMHWWMFCGLLWNMPYEQSTTLQVIGIRKREVTDGMKPAERKALVESKKLYEIEQLEVKREYTREQEKAIDDYDQMMAAIKAKKQAEKEAIEQFRKG